MFFFNFFIFFGGGWGGGRGGARLNEQLLHIFDHMNQINCISYEVTKLVDRQNFIDRFEKEMIQNHPDIWV